MNRRRTLPSWAKWSPMTSSDDRCVRCGSWPDQRLHPTACMDANNRYRGRNPETGAWMTLCPTCAERVGRRDPGVVASGDWMLLPWPVRGRTILRGLPAVVLPYSPLEPIIAGPRVAGWASHRPHGGPTPPFNRHGRFGLRH